MNYFKYSNNKNITEVIFVCAQPKIIVCFFLIRHETYFFKMYDQIYNNVYVQSEQNVLGHHSKKLKMYYIDYDNYESVNSIL